MADEAMEADIRNVSSTPASSRRGSEDSALAPIAASEEVSPGSQTLAFFDWLVFLSQVTIMAEDDKVDLTAWLPSVFREVLCNGIDHINCLSCQYVFSHVWDNYNKSFSHRDITRSIKSAFSNSKKLQIGDEEKTRIFCGLGLHVDSNDNSSSKNEHLANRLLCCYEMWKQARDNELKEKLKREMQQLVFYNPGPSTKDLLGFKPEFSNREKRKLNRLIGDKASSQGKRGKKTKKATLHDNTGRLKTTGQDLCDCMIEDCPGCHYPCPQCNSEKCGSTCRCDRKWTYEVVYYDTKL